jgi:4-amino-4-deoxy-L-arabinose transferase-like glycosyltransferase
MSSTLTGTTSAVPGAEPRTTIVARLFRGRPDDPAWVRPTLLALLAGATVMYLWGLGASGWANAYYSGAAQAGSQSWKAFFFGSFDAANGISVDKPPASLWIMALSVRIFGLSSWSILVPQALMGVAAVGLLYATVRRWSGAVAGLLAGAVLALTPVAVLMFRFNNPDVLLVLLLMAGAYATVRAIETASTRWLMLVGVFIGFAFLTKMLQALLVVPAFALAYLVAAPTSLRRRILQLLAGGLAMLVSAGWWVAIVELVPARYRPYVGSSENDSVLNVIFGYNGLGRIFGGSDTTSGGAGFQGGTPFGFGAGITRLFETQNGGQIAWLLPAALTLLVAALALLWRAPRTDRTRASLILWGGWLLVTGLVFSFMEGTYHEYYTVALAPAVAAVVAVSVVALWLRRDNLIVLAVLAATAAGTAVWAWQLLGRTPDWLPWLRWVVLALGVAAALALLVGKISPRVLGLAAVAAVGTALVGPSGYALNTAATEHRGSTPAAGPAAEGAGFAGGGGFPSGIPSGFPSGFPSGGAMPDYPGLPGGNQGGATGGFPAGGPGGFDSASTVDTELIALLKRDADSYTWVAATALASNAAGYQLATEKPVMAIGGFVNDPWPTLEQLQRYVADGEIHYFVAGSTGFSGAMGGLMGAESPSQQITQWVEATFTATTVGGVTVYDLTAPTA